MTRTTPPDFSAPEIGLARQVLAERYGRPVDIEQVDVELQLDPEAEQLTAVPALYWNERGAEFVVCKLAADRFRCQFQYSSNEQFGTSQPAFTDLTDCLVTLLKLQADHEQTRAGVLTGMTGKNLGGEDYDGPLVI